MKYILETERLSLRKFTIDDTAFIAELVNSEGWLRYIGERNVKTPAQAIAYLENGPMKSYRENGFGLWLVEMKETSTPIGMCGILKRDQLEHPDIGFAFLPAFTGRGFAFEAAAATMIHAKEKLNLSDICAIVMPENTSSIKLLEKIGMKYSKLFRLPDGKEELALYTN
jgi:ribosomal-protein-alanine N-acetyltransferase